MNKLKLNQPPWSEVLLPLVPELQKEIPFSTQFLIEEIIKPNTPEKTMSYPSKISENLRNFFLKKGDTLILDFDSCLCADESLDEIIKLAISDLPNAEELMENITEIMNAGMRGEIDLKTSLQKRLEIADLGGGITEELLLKYLEIAPPPSKQFIEKIKEAFESGVNVFIFSGGFTDFIKLWCEKHDILQYIKGIRANKLLKKENKTYTFDTEKIMTQKDGKTKTLEELQETGEISGKILSIGDSPRDTILSENGILFTQHRLDKVAYGQSKNVLASDELLNEYIQVAV